MTTDKEPKGILVALGENWAKGQHGTKRDLSGYSKDVVTAAEVLLQTDAFHSLIFSTGYTNGTEQISEAKAMANLFTAFYPEYSLPILMEMASFDTPTNFLETKKLIELHGLTGPITVVAADNHTKRVRTIAKKLNIPVTVVSAEKAANLPRRKTRPYEYVLRIESHIDPYGRLPALWTRRRMRTKN